MAERRMFSKRVIDSAKFLKMPVSARLLYYDLGMRADDDGIVEAFTIMRSTGAAEDDLRVLASKGYVTILNEDLVSYITDWTENNKIRPDRKTDSIYKNLLIRISPDVKLVEPKPRADTGKITGAKSVAERTGRPMDDKWTAQDSIGKDRLVEESNSLHSLSSSCPESQKEIVPYQRIVDAYNSTCITMPRCTKLSEARKKHIAVCWRTHGEEMLKGFQIAQESDFLSGRSNAWTGCSFDWLINANNMTKVLEGTYSRNSAAPARKVLARDYTGQYANDVWEVE